MANTQSAKKNIRKSLSRNQRRKNILVKLKRQLKEFTANPEKKNMPFLQKTLDKAAAAGMIKKNRARRLKSRAARRLAKQT